MKLEESKWLVEWVFDSLWPSLCSVFYSHLTRGFQKVHRRVHRLVAYENEIEPQILACILILFISMVYLEFLWWMDWSKNNIIASNFFFFFFFFCCHWIRNNVYCAVCVCEFQLSLCRILLVWIKWSNFFTFWKSSSFEDRLGLWHLVKSSTLQSLKVWP